MSVVVVTASRFARMLRLRQRSETSSTVTAADSSSRCCWCCCSSSSSRKFGSCRQSCKNSNLHHAAHHRHSPAVITIPSAFIIVGSCFLSFLAFHRVVALCAPSEGIQRSSGGNNSERDAVDKTDDVDGTDRPYPKSFRGTVETYWSDLELGGYGSYPAGNTLAAERHKKAFMKLVKKVGSSTFPRFPLHEVSDSDLKGLVMDYQQRKRGRKLLAAGTSLGIGTAGAVMLARSQHGPRFRRIFGIDRDNLERAAVAVGAAASLATLCAGTILYTIARKRATKRASALLNRFVQRTRETHICDDEDKREGDE